MDVRLVVHQRLHNVRMFLGGCPHRQTTPRVVYISSSPPSATSMPAGPPEGVVIEEPPVPEIQGPPPPEVIPPKPAPRRRVVRTEPPAPEPPPETVEPPPVEVPALEPHESPKQQEAFRRQVMEFQGTVLERIHRQQGLRHQGADRRTLEDARIFMAQSARALEAGDLQRALNLSRKAALLLDALEQKP